MTEDLGRVRNAIMRGRRIYLGKLPGRTTERDVKRFFRDYGTVEEVILKNGFAFVEFESSRDAADAVRHLDGRDLLGTPVLVQFARVSRSIAAADAAAAAVKKSGYRLLIDNLSSRVSSSEFRRLVEKYGSINYSEILGDRRAVVEYRHRSDLDDALKRLDGKEIEGRRIRVFEGRTNRSRSRSRERRRERDSKKRRSPVRSRSRSRSRSHSRSESRSSSKSKSKSKSRSRSKSKSKSAERRKDGDNKRSSKRSHSHSSDGGSSKRDENQASSAKRSKTGEEGNGNAGDNGSAKKASKSKSRSRSASRSKSHSRSHSASQSKSRSASKSKPKSKSPSRSRSRSRSHSSDRDSKSVAESANGVDKHTDSDGSD